MSKYKDGKQVRVLFPALLDHGLTAGGNAAEILGAFQPRKIFIMNELKERLAALGLSAEMTDQVITTVADFVKTKVPESYHPMIDDVLAGNKPDFGGILGSLGSLGALTGLFGKK